MVPEVSRFKVVLLVRVFTHFFSAVTCAAELEETRNSRPGAMCVTTVTPHVCGVHAVSLASTASRITLTRLEPKTDSLQSLGRTKCYFFCPRLRMSIQLAHYPGQVS